MVGGVCVCVMWLGGGLLSCSLSVSPTNIPPSDTNTLPPCFHRHTLSLSSSLPLHSSSSLDWHDRAAVYAVQGQPWGPDGLNTHYAQWEGRQGSGRLTAALFVRAA